MQFLQLLGQKPNTSIHLNPTMMVFTRLFFSWQSMINDQLSTSEQNSKSKSDTNCVITSQNCKKELEKYIFTDLSNFGK